MIISSTPIKITLSVGGEKKIDLNGDNYYDFLLKLNNINNGKADLTFKNVQKIKEKIEESNLSPMDSDGDGYSDNVDEFPLDEDEWIDTDNDGIGNNEDIDDDNDGYSDNVDEFPLDEDEWIDTDNDGIGNNEDIDDEVDNNIPGAEEPQGDFDGDGIINLEDEDDDNDGIGDNEDLGPYNPENTQHWVCMTCDWGWDTSPYPMGPFFSSYPAGDFWFSGVYALKAEAKLFIGGSYTSTSMRFKWSVDGAVVSDITVNSADGWKDAGIKTGLSPSVSYHYRDGRYNLQQASAGALVKVWKLID